MDLHLSWALFIPLMLILTEAKKDKELYCAVCRALVDEVNYSISLVDPKKMMQVGSFRIDGKGDQLTKQVPLARSEVHLTEIFESVCEKFKDYAETTNSEGKKSVVRTSSRTGKAISLQNVSISTEKQKYIRFTCDNILEDYEDEMMTVFKKYTKASESEDKLCREFAGVCSEADMQVAMPSSDLTPEEEALLDKAGGSSDSDKSDEEDGKSVDSESDSDNDMEAAPAAGNEEEYVTMTNQGAEQVKEKEEL